MTFNLDWWLNLIEETEDFSKSFLSKNVISASDLDILNSTIPELLTNCVFTDKYRIFVDGKDAKHQILIDNPISASESVAGWVESVFGEKKIAIIINQCESISQNLATKIFNYIEPLIAEKGIPQSGLNITTFIGNYGFTPMGIHQDPRGNNVIHLHLGPGDKYMYNWDESRYNGAFFANKDWHTLKQSAEIYKICTGDFYFMPWNKFHIGVTGELSIGITIWFNNPTNGTLVKTLLDQVLIKYVEKNEGITKPITEKNDVQRSLSDISLSEGLLAEPFGNIMEKIMSDLRFRLASNCYWNSQSLSNKELSLSKNDLKKYIKVILPFQIRYSQISKDKIDIFVRGHQHTFKNNKTLPNVIDALNLNIKMTVSDVMEKLIEDWTQRSTIIFLNLLLQEHGIELSES